MKKFLLGGLALSLLATAPAQADGLRIPLTVFAASTPVAEENIVSPGADDVGVLGLIFMCGDLQDCFISSLSIQGFVDEDSHGTFRRGGDNGVELSELVSSAYLVDNETGAVIGSPEAVDSYGRIQFDDEFTIEKGYTMGVTMYVDISSVGNFNGDPESLGFALLSPFAIYAENEDGRQIKPEGYANRALDLYVTIQE